MNFRLKLSHFYAVMPFSDRPRQGRNGKRIHELGERERAQRNPGHLHQEEAARAHALAGASTS
jgi:hypothetical protein